MKISILSDNRAGENGFLTEHGLSVYVETATTRYLLDTGASGLLIKNAEKAGVDLSRVDWVILSHGHSDHTGGLGAFLTINSTAKVVVATNALNRPFYSRRNGFREISSHIELEKYRERFVFVDDDAWVNEETHVFNLKKLPYPQPFSNETLYMGDADHFMPDDFSHELVTVIGTEHSLIFTGCAHKGILNIMHAVHQHTDFKPSAVLGGFHLVEKTVGQYFEKEEDILNIASVLKEKYADTRFFTGHCTGDTACRLLTEQMNGKLVVFGAGNEFII